MPTKHNKKRYQAHAKPLKALVLTGKLFLKYRDDEESTQAVAGDLLVYPSAEALNTVRQGDYDATGVAGYFKADVFDGKQWQPLLVHDFFPEREHHFSKYECPSDTYVLCEELLQKFAGRRVKRTYREHYELMDEDES